MISLRTLVFLAVAAAAWPQRYTIRTFAGGSGSGDGGPAIRAQIGVIQGIAVDGRGAIYLSDTENHRIRRISPDGVIDTFAGTGQAGSGGDGSPAAQAELNQPYGLAFDARGNLFVADLGNHRVRRIDAAGIVTTVAGTGENARGPDRGVAVNVPLQSPRNVAVAPEGDIFFSEFEGHRIRRVSAEGVLSTAAGTLEALRFPAGVTFDAAGSLVVADSSNHQIRRVAGAALVNLLGRPDVLGPVAVRYDAAGNLYWADSLAAIRRRTPAGRVEPVAGTGEPGWLGDGGVAVRARLQAPRDLAFDSRGNLYIADGTRVRRVTPAGAIETIAGDGFLNFVGDNGPAAQATLHRPEGLALDGSGALLIADTGTRRIRRVTNGVITTVAGTGRAGAPADGLTLLSATLPAPRGVAADASGYPFIADAETHRVWRGVPAGFLRAAAGTGAVGQGNAGPALSMALSSPRAVAFDPAGDFYIADTDNHRVVKVLAGGHASVLVGRERVNAPHDVAWDGAGTLFVADTFNHRVLAVDRSGASRVLDLGVTLRFPQGVALEPGGAVWVADTFQHRVLRWVPGGSAQVIAGSGDAGFSGDGSPAELARLNFPTRLVVAADGSVYVADTGNHRVRRLSAEGSGPEAPVTASGVLRIANAASLQPGPLAPGSLFAVTGAPADAGVSVEVDGLRAEVIAAAPGRVVARTPPSAGVGKAAEVVLLRGGVPVASVAVRIEEAAPALFAVGGVAAALNEDGTAHSAGNPAARGSVVSFFATGEGVTGAPAGLSAGGEAEILYAGPAPGLPGVLQINARMPAGFVPPGFHPVVLRVGEAVSQDGVGIWLR